MNDYWTAYSERLERNQNDLLQLARDIIKKDSSIEVYVHHGFPKRFITNIVFFKGDLKNEVAFHEVPYRWSGCGYEEFGKSHPGGENSSMPFDANDVLNTFKHVNKYKKRQPNVYFKSKKEYLEWYSFYKKLEL